MNKTKNIDNILQTKKFCIMKKTINKVNRQPDEWEKIFPNHIFNKGLISKIHKEFTQLNRKKPNNPIKKWTEDMNSFFFNFLNIFFILDSERESEGGAERGTQNPKPTPRSELSTQSPTQGLNS